MIVEILERPARPLSLCTERIEPIGGNRLVLRRRLGRREPELERGKGSAQLVKELRNGAATSRLLPGAKQACRSGAEHRHDQRQARDRREAHHSWSVSR